MAVFIKKIKNSKAGIGIAEVLVASVILGFMVMALNHLQSSNRDSVIRIRSRDGAIAVSQQVMDSLSALGVASLHGDDNTNRIVLHKELSWTGTPGIVETTSKVNYTVIVNIAPDETYQNVEISKHDTTRHVYAKRLDVTVAWSYKGFSHSINTSGIVR